ncbi:hypothetical protein [Microcoleus sp.]|uniref:hypothetical protein n=1 Tax=Microcoleus sp. TaxID=44472 RepID=UPI00403EF1ED
MRTILLFPIIAVLKRGEVCPMPYAHGGLCPMHVGYLMLLRKAIPVSQKNLNVATCFQPISSKLFPIL